MQYLPVMAPGFGGITMYKQERYSVGDAAAMCDVSIQTLRYYDKIGLVQPAEKNADTGYRYYRKEQLVTIQAIKVLKNLEFSLDEIRDMLNASSIDYLQARIQEKLNELRIKIDLLHATYDSAVIFLERLQHGSSVLKSLENSLDANIFSEDVIQLEDIPAHDVIYLRRMLDNYRNEDLNIERWTELLALVQREKVPTTGQISIIYHNKPLENFYTKVCDYEVCIPVKATNPRHSQYYRHIDAFQAITAYHVGSYDGLLKPYMMLMRWIEENGYRVSGPARDSFIISPIDTSNPDEYVTKIIIPVCKND